MKTSFLEIKNLSFRFPGNQVQALRDINLGLEGGKIHALLGENGAGKSTLARLCTGQMALQSGSLLLDGREASLKNCESALSRGLALVPQHPEVATKLSVAENLVLGMEHGLLTGGLVNRKRLLPALRERLGKIGFAPDLDAKAGQLNSSEIHWLALAEALLTEPRWLFLDEPSAPYGEEEVERLYGLLKRRADSGLGVVVITHRLSEVKHFADTIHVLRQGRLVLSGAEAKSLKDEELLEAMFRFSETEAKAALSGGEPDPERLQKTADAPGQGLEIRKLGYKGGPGRLLREIDLDVRPGSIVGVLGLKDQGMEVLEDLLCGFLPARPGSVTLGGAELSGVGQEKRGYIPSRRFQRGIAVGLSVRENLLVRLRKRYFGTFVGKRKRESLTAGFRFPAPSDDRKILTREVETLSGGTIQKLILSRETSNPAPDFLLCAEPYWGLDKSAQEEFSRNLRLLAKNGCAVLVLSSDLEEILELCEEIHVLNGGTLVYRSPRSSAVAATLAEQLVKGRGR